MEAESRVDSYTMPLDAELAKAYLESYEIPVRLDGELLGGTAFALGPMMGGIRLYVGEHDERRARALLDEYHHALHERSRVGYEESGDVDAQTSEESVYSNVRERRTLSNPADVGAQLREAADDEATHAWVAALAGVVFFPVLTHCYSIACLLRVPEEALSPRGRRRYLTAWLVDLLVLATTTWLLWRWLA